MKLTPTARVPLGDTTHVLEKSTYLSPDCRAIIAVEAQEESGWERQVLLIDDSGITGRVTLPEGSFGAKPVIIPLSAVETAVLSDETIITFLGADGQLTATVDVTSELPESWEGTTAGGVARALGGDEWLVRLTDPMSFQNPRAIATLRFSDNKAAWTQVEFLAGKQFPMSGMRKFIAPDGTRAPIVGDVQVIDGTRFVSAEGSDSMSVNKYGSDFFTLAELDADGSVSRRVYEESGWTKQAGKQGIRARFTSDGTAAIMSPVFGTSAWKGRSQLVTLTDGRLDEVPRIRGAAEFVLVDVREDTALLVSRSEVMFARIERT